jgi:hypothetical protein
MFLISLRDILSHDVLSHCSPVTYDITGSAVVVILAHVRDLSFPYSNEADAFEP